MIEVVGVQFKNNVRLYYFDPQGETYKRDDKVVVETERGLELATIFVPNKFLEDDELKFELKPIIRKAWKSDIEKEEEHNAQLPAIFKFFKEQVKALKIEMKPLYCEITIDGSKIVFYYYAEDRVDFRELVKVLSQNYRNKIELHQVSERDAARVIGALGICGRPICCKSCLNNFDFVTMKMAKEQGLSLNLSKISGACGKLMCCIGYEVETYRQLKELLPAVGSFIKTPGSDNAKVISVDYMKELLRVQERPDKEELTVYLATEIPSLKEGIEEFNKVQIAKVEKLGYNTECNCEASSVNEQKNPNKPSEQKTDNNQNKNKNEKVVRNFQYKKFKRHNNGKNNK